MRNTLIRRVSGELVVVPNATILKNPVDVLTNWVDRRVTVIAGIAYDEDVDSGREVIRKAVEGCTTVHTTIERRDTVIRFGAVEYDVQTLDRLANHVANE